MASSADSSVNETSSKFAAKESSSIVSPPKLEHFSTQICTKTGDNTSQSSCLLNLTIDDSGKKEKVSVELPRDVMGQLVADLGRVRDQLAVIAGHK